MKKLFDVFTDFFLWSSAPGTEHPRSTETRPSTQLIMDIQCAVPCYTVVRYQTAYQMLLTDAYVDHLLDTSMKE